MFWKIRDPVCKARVKRDTEYQVKYKGKTYYFDCSACMNTFEKNPEEFVGKRKKESFLEKIAKSNDGQPKSCH